MIYWRYVFCVTSVTCIYIQIWFVKTFKYSKIVLIKVGIEGTGFEPKIAALFGRNGFFPDFISKLLYWAGGKVQMLGGVWDKMAPNKDKLKEQVKLVLSTFKIIYFNKTLPLTH